MGAREASPEGGRDVHTSCGKQTQGARRWSGDGGAADQAGEQLPQRCGKERALGTLKQLPVAPCEVGRPSIRASLTSSKMVSEARE